MNGLTKMPDKASVKGYTYINKMLVATILVTGSLEADTADMGIWYLVDVSKVWLKVDVWVCLYPTHVESTVAPDGKQWC